MKTNKIIAGTGAREKAEPLRTFSIGLEEKVKKAEVQMRSEQKYRERQKERLTETKNKFSLLAYGQSVRYYSRGGKTKQE